MAIKIRNKKTLQRVNDKRVRFLKPNTFIVYNSLIFSFY